MTKQTESAFGINGYKAPKDEEARLQIKNLMGKMIDNNVARKTTIDLAIANSKEVPAPNQYLQQWKWDKKLYNNGRPKGKFLTDKRVTMTQ